jgi:putative DNA primase/helicase
VTDWTKTPFYSAYLVTKSKKPIGEFTKTTNNHCLLEQVQRLNEYAGILAPNAVLLDADEQPHSDNLLKIIQGERLSCMVTSRNGGRGNHALFLDADGIITRCGGKVALACGLVVDVKAGNRNSYECLKIDGVERTIVYDVDEYGQLPKYFTPISSVPNFAAMDEGDGRNDALFSYILMLQAVDFTVDQIKETFGIINKYVLKTPVSDSELDSITREAAFTKMQFFKKNVFQHDKFAEYLKRTHSIKRVNGQLCLYRSGAYVGAHKYLAAEMIAELPQLTKAKRNEVWQHLEDNIVDSVSEASANLIAFRNGIFNLTTGELSPCSSDVVILNRIPWDYNPNAKCAFLDEVLNAWCCGDMEIRALLEEMVGYCFYRKNTYRKGFVITGNKRSGKSKFLTLIINTLGVDNICNLDLAELNDRFSTIMLFGKLANIGDDIGDEYNANPSVFKKIISGNEISAEQKGQPKFNFKPFVKLIFSANDMPRTKDPSGAVQDRLILIPFKGHFQQGDDGFIPDIAEVLNNQTAIEYFILLGIEGLKRLISKNLFTKSAKVENELSEYERENSPVLAFVDEVGVDNIDNEPTSEVLTRFNVFCASRGFRSMSITKFTRELKAKAGFDVGVAKRFGKSIKVYMHKRE